MNNPDSNFLSPLRTQPQKKQRGGSTPRSVLSSRSRESASQSQSLVIERESPVAATVATSTAASVDPMTEGAGDAIARRRAELRRLQAQRESRSLIRPEVVTPSMALQTVTVTQGANDAGSGASNTTAKANNANIGPPPPTTIPKPGEPVARHHSDLFPTVQKSPGTTKAAVPPLARPVPSIPPVSVSRTAPSQLPTATVPVSTSTKPPKAPLSGNAPPPPPVNRKLEFARAKSAPPARPPPPPPKGIQMPPQAKEAPLTTTSTTSSAPTNKGRRPPPVWALLLDPSPPAKSRNQVGDALQSSAPPSIETNVLPVTATPHKLEDSKPPIMETKTPAPIQTPAILPPSTSRRDRIKSIREGVADTNMDSTTSASAEDATARCGRWRMSYLILWENNGYITNKLTMLVLPSQLQHFTNWQHQPVRLVYSTW